MLRQLLLSDDGHDGFAAGDGWALVQAEFPTVSVGPLSAGRGARVLTLDVSEWGSPHFDPVDWDGRVFGAADTTEHLALHLEGARQEALAIAALEILTRYQGLVGRRNAASATPLFDTLLVRHRALQDLSRPAGRADYQRALDAWQWVLRLRPDAGMAVQAAALFHEGEPHAQAAHGAQAFRNVLVPRGPDAAREVLGAVGVNAATREQVRQLLAKPERPEDDADVALLNDADALSFFSLNASSFIRYFSPEYSRRKVADTLARLRPGQLRRLGQMRLAPAVRNLLEVQLATLPVPEALD